MLLEALGLYERHAREVNRGDARVLPRVLMVVTGKGPLKEKYMREVDALQNASDDEGWKWVRCISLWLEAEDYPILLGLFLWLLRDSLVFIILILKIFRFC